MDENLTTWNESDSETFILLGMVAVPDREQQMATVASLLPFEREASFQVVELSSGEGLLAYTLLDCFANASLLALDLSVAMLARASELLVPFLSRCKLEEFNLLTTGWLERIDGMDAVVSSLAIHHLDNEGKRQLFHNVLQRLAPGGAFIIADLVHPQRPEANQLFAGSWDYIAEEQSFIEAGNAEPYERFVNEKWNHYRYPDEMDTPSSLVDQLLWLREAGYVGVDCFWMRAGHAVYGGYKPDGSPPGKSVAFRDALASAERATNASMALSPGPDWWAKE